MAKESVLSDSTKPSQIRQTIDYVLPEYAMQKQKSCKSGRMRGSEWTRETLGAALVSARGDAEVGFESVAEVKGIVIADP